MAVELSRERSVETRAILTIRLAAAGDRASTS